MSSPRERARLTWLDSLKGFAILCVVAGHVVYGYIKAGAYPDSAASEFSLLQFFASFHMPLFILISGFIYSMVYFDAAGQPKMGKLKVQLLDIAAIYVIFSALLVLFKVICAKYVNTQMSFSDLLFIWRTPVPPYWYLYALAVFYLIGIPLLKSGRRSWLFVGLAVSAALGFASRSLALTPDFAMNSIAFLLVFFILGVAIQRGALPLSWPLAIGSFCVACALYCVFRSQDYVTFAGEIAGQPVVSTLVAAGFCLFLFKVFSSVSWLDNRFLTFCGSYCLEIYVLHCFFTAGFRAAFNMVGVSNFWLSFFLNLALSTAIPLAIALVLKKIGLHDIVFRPAHWVAKRRKA